MRKFINHYDRLRDIFTSGKELQDRFFRVALVLSTFIGLIYTTASFLAGFSVGTYLGGMIITFIFAALLIFHIKKPSGEKINKAVFFTSLMFAINALWLTHGGSQSPFLIAFAAIPVMLIFICSRRITIALSVLIGLNLIVLHGIEWHFPQMITSYASEQQKSIDHTIVLVLFFTGFVPGLLFIRNRILGEKTRADRENQLKSTYLANMSHEIRTPMNAIVGFTELMQYSDIHKDEMDEYIGIIRENSQLLLELINNVLDLSKLEANLIATNITKFSIQDFFDQLYNAHITQARKAGLHFEKDLPVDLERASIQSDRTLLFQVFSNLINNAIKITQKGEVRFGVRQKNNQLSFFVFDTGPGIPPEMQKKIFERFSQLSDHKNMPNQGSGLGLSITRAFLELLGGDIKLYSNVNQGSTFVFSFPVHILEHPQLFSKIQEYENIKN